eukprot:TRINITY_DN2226_c0_g1_i1.p1 TRINITY_DN2226_c0_g1~~TRINITY_DN2226_c0_g1_i1.p1  ORF type:complete len:512 (-),score=199.42 TRINITY_DN2226_c0_g1_i1:156-1691(-)
MGDKRFATHMLDGFETLYKRTEEVLKSLSDFGKFFSSLSSAELAYGKALNKVSSMNTKKGTVAIELGSVKNSWETTHNELDVLSTKHTTFGNQLAEMSNTVRNWTKDATSSRAKVVSKGQALTKEVASVMAALDKAKKDYESKCKSAESAAAALAKSRSEGTTKPKELAKLQSKSTKAMDAAKAADNEYKKQLEAANGKQTSFYQSEMPGVLSEFEDWETQRLNFMRELFEQYSQLQSEFPAFMDERSKAVHAAVSAIDVKDDIKSYIDTAQTGVAPPPAIQYEPYSNDFKIGSEGGARSADGGGGADASRGPAAANAAAGGPMTFPDVDDESLSVDERIGKLSAQQDELRDCIKAETKSKKGLEKLVKFYATDPVAQEKAKGELEEQKKKIQAMKDQRQKVEEKLAELQGGAARGGAGEEASAYPDEPPPAYEPEPAYEEGEAAYEGEYTDQFWEASALYDYEATNDTELSFNEGDVLVITERDESGWWFAELRGEAGFVPENYVSIIGE